MQCRLARGDACLDAGAVESVGVTLTDCNFMLIQVTEVDAEAAALVIPRRLDRNAAAGPRPRAGNVVGEFS